MPRRFVDLSVPLETGIASDPPQMLPQIEYLDHQQTAEQVMMFFPGLQKEDLPGGEGWAIEMLQIATHNGTHVDAPWHYHSTMNKGERAATIDEVPLEWCFGPGVKLDFRDKPDGHVVSAAEIEAELDRIGHALQPLDIVLVNTSAGERYGHEDYLLKGCGMGREATNYLTGKGVRMVGTDAWSWDAPFAHTAQAYAKTGDASIIWEGHRAGMDQGYCQIEKMTNLDQLPDTGFTVSAFPFKIKAASAGFTAPLPSSKRSEPMRLGTVCYEKREHVVADLGDGKMLDLHLAAEHADENAGLFVDMLSVIYGGDTALDLARALIANAQDAAILLEEEITFCPPILPVQYRDCLVFETHLMNSFAAAEKMTGKSFGIPDVWYKQPVYYKGNRMSFIGHQQDVQWPGYAQFLDVELELAIIIGKKGKDITAADAPGYIFGYSVLNDVSARDAQMVEMPGQLGPAKGKDFDTGNILGPWITTADEIPHPAALDMEVHVNGDRWGGGNSSQMHHDFGRIIEHISASETLYPGEVIGSGTVGTGCGLETGKQLQPGDQFELTIEKIGTLTNRIIKP